MVQGSGSRVQGIGFRIQDQQLPRKKAFSSLASQVYSKVDIVGVRYEFVNF